MHQNYIYLIAKHFQPQSGTGFIVVIGQRIDKETQHPQQKANRLRVHSLLQIRANFVSILYKYCQILCKYNANNVQICKYCKILFKFRTNSLHTNLIHCLISNRSNIVRITCKYYANIVQILCKYCANIVQILL